MTTPIVCCSTIQPFTHRTADVLAHRKPRSSACHISRARWNSLQLCRGVDQPDRNLCRRDHPDSVVRRRGLVELPETKRSNQNIGQRKGKSHEF